MRFLYLFPFGTIDKKLLEKLGKNLEKKFGLPTKIVSPIPVPDYTYSKMRKQYDGSKILQELNRMDFLDAEKILGICQVDLFAEDLNFIFGQAEAPGNVCLISLFRLDPKFYYKRPNLVANSQEIFYQRILKEAIHELGHTYGLSHCPDSKCVMHFSNTLSDTDTKQENFCQKCGKLFEMMKK